VLGSIRQSLETDWYRNNSNAEALRDLLIALEMAKISLMPADGGEVENLSLANQLRIIRENPKSAAILNTVRFRLLPGC
jgi:hypothetical protein